jgi:hypothetical protein
LDGEPAACVTIPRATILGLKLYETPEAMNHACEKYHAQKRYREQVDYSGTKSFRAAVMESSKRLKGQ